MSESDVVKEMGALLREKSRSWGEILEHFAGQPYPVV
jgi:4-hydroxy-3-polyprenylbenzoate decarboxylase